MVTLSCGVRQAQSVDEKGRKRLKDKHEGGGKLGLDLERETERWKRNERVEVATQFHHCLFVF